MRLLVVEDEQTLLLQLKRAFESERYLVTTALDGEEALDRLAAGPVDLIILDIMLPKRDGLSVLRAIRESGMATPVLILTAKGDPQDKVAGLDCGADDYLAKPFSTAELMARVRALLRRSGEQKDTVLRVGTLWLDTRTREVGRGDAAIELTAREFSILEFLLYNKNRAISRFSLAEHVWGDAFDPFSMSNFMDVHIKNLRKKIDVPGPPSIIRTIRGVGYIIREDAP